MRDGLVVRCVQRRVDGDEPDVPVPELEEPKSRGGGARIMCLDVEEVYTPEDFFGQFLNEWSVFPIIPGGEKRYRVNRGEEKVVWCITNRRRT